MKYLLNLKLVDGHEYSTDLSDQELRYLTAGAKDLNGHPVSLFILAKLWGRDRVNAIETAVLVKV